MIKEIIVVEGKEDTVAIRRAVEAETIETGGSAINEEILSRIELAQTRRGVIIFTDPDHAGERIRKIISARVPGCQHAFLNREDAEYRGDIGVENADPQVIRKALSEIKTEYRGCDSQISWNDLMQAGLINQPESAKRREVMGKILGIGYANGKQFYKRCAIFQISREEFLRAYDEMKKEDHDQ